MEEDIRREAILSALLALPPRQFSVLTRTVAADTLCRLQRLSALLVSPSRFFLTLNHIESMSSCQKPLLIGRILLRTLRTITHNVQPSACLSDPRDYDAGLLLLTLCQMSESERGDTSDWRVRVISHVVKEMIGFSGLGFTQWGVLGPYLEVTIRCQRVIDAVGVESENVAASKGILLSLKVPRGSNSRRVCVICREDVIEKWDACELPCQHVFHWVCVARWLKQVNTCPCCRLELPTDDVFHEIRRLWRVIFSRSRFDITGIDITKEQTNSHFSELHPGSNYQQERRQ